MSTPPAAAELVAMSNFSFLRGASHPEELVARAAELGLEALAVADRNTLAGSVRAWDAGRRQGLPVRVASRIVLRDGRELVLLPEDRTGYGALCRLLTLGKRRAPKGQCWLDRPDIEAAAGRLQAILLPPETGADADLARDLAALRGAFGARLSLALRRRYADRDLAWCEGLAALAGRMTVPLLATCDVLCHDPARRPLQDVLTCIREGMTIDSAGRRLEANAERHLKGPAELARLFAPWPRALDRTLEVADACRFDLGSLRYEYPEEIVTPGLTAQEDLTRRVAAGAAQRYPAGIPEAVAAQIAKELAFIGAKDYAPFFLTVDEIVRFARSRGILAQGRGSAANSAVCYVLGITSVDPAEGNCLFERFISEARAEAPDIDVDFEHARREEVIQHIYARYGRDRAGLAATVIHYRWRRAIREVGKALGVSEDVTAALSRYVWGWSDEGISDAQVRELGLDPQAPRLKPALALARALMGFPRHLSQHVGGFVIARGLLSELVPIENAAMADRTVIEWDKDDIERLGILKVDVLALGMLTCIARSFALLAVHYRLPLDLDSVPREDPAVYDMLCRADSVGVFQVESRAQMNMLPRLRPRTFYDLVIEVAIVRPGPIQGDMVHPYLRRRQGLEPVDYPSAALRQVLEKTLGVPLFQEQAMRIAMVAAGFSAAEADALRRAMATFKQGGQIEKFRDRLIGGMIANGYDRTFAERCFKQIEGFGTYGFPESHAASFARLVYVSAWLKCHYPEVFACALLNAQPMGFYAPAQLVGDARAHGVVVRPPDVNASAWDSSLEPLPSGRCALRLGLRLVKGLSQVEAARLVAARTTPFESLTALWRRAGLSRAAIARLADADAFAGLGLLRRQALWEAARLTDAPLPLFAAADAREGTNAPEAPEPAVTLPALPPEADVVQDYRTLGLSLKAHPFGFLRPHLAARGVVPAAGLAGQRDGTRVRVCGMVLVRQRPGSASGVIFISLEDETGVVNVIVWPKLFETYRRAILGARFLMVEGRLQREQGVTHVIAARLHDVTRLSARLDPEASAFAGALARADEVAHPGHDRRNAALARRAGGEPAPLPHRSRDFH